MNVEPEASFLVQVKNPDPSSGGRDGGGFHGLQSKRRAAFPAHLQGAFGSRRYAPLGASREAEFVPRPPARGSRRGGGGLGRGR